MSLEAFNIYRSDDDAAESIGVGVKFPSGDCYVEWVLTAFPPEKRLDHDHVSIYGSYSDVEQGTGGVVRDVVVVFQ